MEVLRFYCRQGGSLEYLAKYVAPEDRGLQKIREICEPIVHRVEGGDLVDVFNDRLAMADRRLTEGGFDRVDAVSSSDFDHGASKCYDAVIDADVQTMTVIVYDVVHTDDPETPYEKRVAEKVLLGSIQ